MSGPAAYRLSPHTALLGSTLLTVAVLIILSVTAGLHSGWIAAPILLYVVVCGFAAAEIRGDFFLRSIHKGNSAKTIALTFDDGPHPDLTPRILDILKDRNVPATFFVIGKHAAAAPAILNRIVQEGHLVGNHSYNHSFHFDWQSSSRMIAEMEATDKLIEKETGKRPQLFRPPYGVTNPMLANALALSGHYSIGWSLRSLDTRKNSPQELLKRVFSQLKGGDIILLHDTLPNTADTLTALIDGARERGFTFAALDSLIPVKPYA